MNAFPTNELINLEGNGIVVPKEDGMTLRDYFAAKAMQSFLMDCSESHIADKAKRAYAMADFMLKERDKQS